MNNPFTRREFLSNGIILASAAACIPSFIQSSAHAMAAAMNGLSSTPGVPDHHILVVIQLSGGNDGLNTVVPFGAAEYHRARQGIGVKENEALKLADGIGLHPQLAPLKALYDEGLVSIIQGVGYPNPNRSHFKSMDIWHTADTSATGDGWLGRYFDSECCGFGKGEGGRIDAQAVAGQPGIAIGRTAPLAMIGRGIKPVSFESAELFKWTGADIHPTLRHAYETASRREPAADAPDDNASFLLRTALDAQISSDQIRKAVALQPRAQYPGNELGRQLRMVASMIRAGLKTRVYYVSLGGFDTHAGQGGAQGRHANLLNQYSLALRAFISDLKASEQHERVLTMTFSEFGRRVGQNASGGTDHGTAAPMILAGPMVKPGLCGSHPSLKDLDDGDLKYHTDFRAVYTAILERWMKADSRKILGGSFQPVDVIRRA